MSDASAVTEDTPRKASKLPLIIGVVLMLVGGGGSFFAIYTGMLFGSGSEHATESAEAPAELAPLPDVSFVAVDPMVISLGRPSDNRHLRFRAQLEVTGGHQKDVEALLPRVIDVLNSYLRALEVGDLEDPAILIRLRAQMLRRVQVVTGPGLVQDLLIMEFVLT